MLEQSMISQKKIVIVEDEPDILEVLRYNLEREGFQVISCLDGVAGLASIERYLPDLVFLDLMLPGLDGLEICRRLKNNKHTAHIPVIMVTAKGEESDIVIGLGLGADDYIPKPFSPRELTARAKAVLRRTSKTEANSAQTIQFDGLLIDPVKFMVSLNDHTIKLTATEFRLLHYLASNAGQVFTRDQLLDQAFGSHAVVVDRNVDVHIRAIRRKIGEDPQFVETIRGVGYRFRDMGE